LSGGDSAIINGSTSQLTYLNQTILRSILAQSLSVSVQLLEIRPEGGKLQPAVTERSVHSLDPVFLLNINTAYRFVITISHNSAAALPVTGYGHVPSSDWNNLRDIFNDHRHKSCIYFGPFSYRLVNVFGQFVGLLLTPPLLV